MHRRDLISKHEKEVEMENTVTDNRRIDFICLLDLLKPLNSVFIDNNGSIGCWMQM